MKRMNTKILVVFVILLGLVFHNNALALSITNIDVIPSQPLNTDLITFSISGISVQSYSWVDHDVFSQNGTALQLDLYVNHGVLPAVSNWDYSKQIQPLVQGIYSLEVRAIPYGYQIPADTDIVSFTVVPEPNMIALFGLGLPLIRNFSKRKSCK